MEPDGRGGYKLRIAISGAENRLMAIPTLNPQRFVNPLFLGNHPGKRAILWAASCANLLILPHSIALTTTSLQMGKVQMCPQHASRARPAIIYTDAGCRTLGRNCCTNFKLCRLFAIVANSKFLVLVLRCKPVICNHGVFFTRASPYPEYERGYGAGAPLGVCGPRRALHQRPGVLRVPRCCLS